MDDLNAASLEDVYEWFETYYGAANAVIVAGGRHRPRDGPSEGRAVLRRHPRGPARHQARDVWIAPRTGDPPGRQMQDRVPQARVDKAWNVPEWGSEDAIHLGLFARVLASSGKNIPAVQAAGLRRSGRFERERLPVRA